MFLIDTMVLSELRKPDRDSNVTAWFEDRDDDLYLSVVTVGEVERGIGKQRRNDPRFAARLEEWLDQVLISYGNRVLPVDIGVARRWGRLTDALGRGDADILIAATAIEHGLTVVTRNLRHFADTGAIALDPYSPGRP